jgi:amidohydrolase
LPFFFWALFAPPRETLFAPMTQAAVDNALRDWMIAFRRDLHRHPELSWKEFRTARKIAEALDSLGISYRAGVAETGIIADLPGPEGVPAVALRADIDALPIQEETKLDFASVHSGVMHACGHDAHTTMLLGAAALLVREKSLPAPVRLIFQPAEELGEGAQKMIQAGALEGAGAIFGGHVDRLYSAGELVVTEGPVGASTDQFKIILEGRGGHGARPHESVDALVAGAGLVLALQTIVSREIDPAAPAVVTIGSFHAGTASNVIADRAELEGTLRAMTPEVRERLLQALRRMTDATAALHRAAASFALQSGSPPVMNSPEATQWAREAALAVAGEGRVFPMRGVNMGAEDFSFYLQKVPGCYIRVGTRPASGESHPAHSSRFDINEDALAVGAAYFATVAKIAGERLRQTALKKNSK